MADALNPPLAPAVVRPSLRFLLAQNGRGLPPGAVLSRAIITSLLGLAVAVLARYPLRERWREARLRRLRALRGARTPGLCSRSEARHASAGAGNDL